MRRGPERGEWKREVERERSRIARDIHDNLGAHLTRLTMMTESALNDPADPERTAKRLRMIYDTARELTSCMDEIVWAVTPRHDTLEAFALYFERFAQDMLAAAGIRCCLDLPLQFPEARLSPEIRHNVFLAAKEAVHNAVKHSRASQVTIRLVPNEQSFDLTIHDNGIGISISDSRGGTRGRIGNGVGNMRRRLADIGGRFRIESAVGLGTGIAFHVPIDQLRRPASKANGEL